MLICLCILMPAALLGRGGQAVARSSCWPQVLGRVAQAVARGAVPYASQARLHHNAALKNARFPAKFSETTK
jgi:hypothetical protein